VTAELRQRLRAAVVAGAGDGALVDGGRLTEMARAEAPLLTDAEIEAVVADVVSAARGLGPLDPILLDGDVTDVMVNGDGEVWVERRGEVARAGIHLDGNEVGRLIERVVAPLGLRVDRASPIVDARLPDGSRVHAVVPPLSVDGPCLTIRRFAARRLPLSAFCAGAVSDHLHQAVTERRNILVSGGTGAGKTTLLNTLAGDIPARERIITVEDAAELRLEQPHVVRLEARPANADGVGEVRIRDLVRTALRMRPDRIVVGECRGPEALDMLQAMNTGHAGSMSTCHANGPADALRRLETMVLMGDVALPLPAIREQLGSALDLVVQVARGPGGRRSVVEVARVEIVDGELRTLAVEP
jgi:pilus assembly protein CpaF